MFTENRRHKFFGVIFSLFWANWGIAAAVVDEDPTHVGGRVAGADAVLRVPVAAEGLARDPEGGAPELMEPIVMGPISGMPLTDTTGKFIVGFARRIPDCCHAYLVLENIGRGGEVDVRGIHLTATYSGFGSTGVGVEERVVVEGRFNGREERVPTYTRAFIFNIKNAAIQRIINAARTDSVDGVCFAITGESWGRGISYNCCSYIEHLLRDIGGIGINPLEDGRPTDRPWVKDKRFLERILGRYQEEILRLRG